MHKVMTVNKPPLVTAAWQALYRYSNLPTHLHSVGYMLSGAIIIIIIIIANITELIFHFKRSPINTANHSLLSC